MSLTSVALRIHCYTSALRWSANDVVCFSLHLLPSTVVPTTLPNNTMLLPSTVVLSTHRSPRLTPYPASFVVLKGLPKLTQYPPFAVVFTGLPCRFFMLHSTHKAFLQHAHNLAQHCSRPSNSPARVTPGFFSAHPLTSPE